MKTLNAKQLTCVSGGVPDNVAQCEDGYLKASLYIPAHPTHQTLGVVIALTDTEFYEKIEDILSKEGKS